MSSQALSEMDLHLFNEGRHFRLYDRLGAHLTSRNGTQGVLFSVWAPNAREVSVIGDFNDWRHGVDCMSPQHSSGIWQSFVPNAGPGSLYKFHIVSGRSDHRAEKADPFGFASELRPRTASKVWDHSNYHWNDTGWMRSRGALQQLDAAISIYEVHLGSWMRVPDEGNRWLSYRELAVKLAEYVEYMGFTHIELLPISEHPFDGSWGYQTIGLFSPTSRFGTPDDFKYFVDYLHEHGIGVLLDWVPAHFPRDEHGLAYFDGTHLYEHDDPRKGEHKDWGTLIYNYGRYEVVSTLVSNALFWLDKYHIDGLRVDAVASMLYLDYSRKEGEWVPNQFGGRENLEALSFLKTLNTEVYAAFPDVMTIAEESTAFPGVSRPVHLGGLGFGYKWDMGWMHDTLSYLAEDPIHRRYHHNRLTFRSLYAFSENYMLPLSHDEVVHGKRSLLSKMPGDTWQQFANLRLLYGYMFGQSGKKLLFMGGEFGQWNEWNFDASLDWHLAEHGPHRGIQLWLRDLNDLYRSYRALHQRDCNPEGIYWIDCSDAESSILCWLRRGDDPSDQLLFIANFTPVPRHHYRVGVPQAGFWKELLNSDAALYHGSGIGNLGGRASEPQPWHNFDQSIELSLPPLAVCVFRRSEELP